MARKILGILSYLLRRETNIMRPRKALLYGSALLACGLCAAGAQADPVTVQFFYTTFAGGVNVDNVANVTLSGGTLTLGAITPIASTAGADGILFLPDGNLAIAGQNINNPAQVHEITTGGAAVTSVSTTASSNGSYHLALSSSSPFGRILPRIEASRFRRSGNREVMAYSPG